MQAEPAGGAEVAAKTHPPLSFFPVLRQAAAHRQGLAGQGERGPRSAWLGRRPGYQGSTQI